ncbi:hypothetical protein DYI25_14725 [Mesobacillus boroniphilus]|uniref:Uncharacterized protein n=1 Tax=Mesobacillus boroniphilus TaxID=308892 RepID=A0A944CM56_9BACI|nr:hypothetical protein [Mesobacillus boroniphilus]MBS8265678.1 hypothetical protein [Mesobacillus boroniphilus]
MKKINPVILLVVIVLGVYVGLKINNDPTLNTTKEKTNTQLNTAVETTVDTKVSAENKVEEASNNRTLEPNYQIIHSIDKRYDGGTSYYVLIDPVKLNNTGFMDDVKNIINKFVKDYGRKISIEIFDDREVLELEYKLFGDLSLDRPLTENEYQQKAIHYIAGFSGELETGLYLNSLYFFPSADSGTPEVGNYVKTMEFNPK